MTSLFEDALDIPAWLAHDRACPFGERLHRDREIGLGLPAGPPVSRVRSWWNTLSPNPHPDLGARLNRARGWLCLAVAGLGTASGVGLALFVLRYDGNFPVNVVAVIAVLVVLPVLLMLTSVLLMPGRLPGLGGLQDMVAALNIGNFAASLINRQRADGESTVRLDWGGAPAAGLARLARWQILVFSQIAGTAFAIAAAATALTLVAFTDLAFGWSTTLDVPARHVAQWVDLLSIPWAGWLPGAVPDLSLIEASRYYRLADIGVTVHDADRLTGWWPFLMMSLLTYGVVPRIGLLLFAVQRLTAASRHTLLADPGVHGLLDRMDSAVLDTAGEGIETPASAPPQPQAAAADRLTGPLRIIAFDLTADPRPVTDWIATHTDTLSAEPVLLGGENTLEEDERALATFDPNDATHTIVLVKGWEPPLLASLDLLRAVRARLGAETSIMVVPLGLDGRPPAAVELGAWHHSVSSLADPGTYVESLSAGSSDA